MARYIHKLLPITLSNVGTGCICAMEGRRKSKSKTTAKVTTHQAHREETCRA
ncbi:hypothetical protein DM02DRAFT_415555 [Periconia macrospinosa]|uniref:Uncharacterized protein n=1 Tax=Periconia macrospinosa TaxID=97972 RepID=A0A2V1CYH7_9PLEO|nr:hypothetical protein DM02DRAFT_415555 [Periconia macrospinosa]